MITDVANTTGDQDTLSKKSSKQDAHHSGCLQCPPVEGPLYVLIDNAQPRMVSSVGCPDALGH